MAPRQLGRGVGRRHAFGNLPAGQDLGQRLAAAETFADAAVAGQRTGARQHEVSHAGEAAKGLLAPAEAHAEPGDLVQPAGHQRRQGVVAESEAGGDAGGQSNHVLQRAGELHADDVVAGVEAEVGRGEPALDLGNPAGVGSGEHGSGRQRGRHLTGERRAGERHEARLPHVQLRGDDLVHPLQRPELDALARRDERRVRRHPRTHLPEDVAGKLHRNDEEHRRRPLAHRSGIAAHDDLRNELELLEEERVASRRLDSRNDLRLSRPQRHLAAGARQMGRQGGTP